MVSTISASKGGQEIALRVIVLESILESGSDGKQTLLVADNTGSIHAKDAPKAKPSQILALRASAVQKGQSLHLKVLEYRKEGDFCLSFVESPNWTLDNLLPSCQTSREDRYNTAAESRGRKIKSCFLCGNEGHKVEECDPEILARSVSIMCAVLHGLSAAERRDRVERFLLPHGIKVEHMSWYATNQAAVMYVRLENKNDALKACQLSLSTGAGDPISIIPVQKTERRDKGKGFGGNQRGKKGKGKGKGAKGDKEVKNSDMKGKPQGGGEKGNVRGKKRALE